MSNKHARFSPSAAYRRLNCPPSLKLEEQFVEKTSSYAAEGSAGHALGEHLIKKYLKMQSKRPVSNYYSDDLLEAVDEYVLFVTQQIEETRRNCKDPIFSVEQRVDASEYVSECFGTADMVIITDTLVHVIDLKLGRGVEVDAEENPQLMIYGLGVLSIAEILFDDIKMVRLTIFQPRLNNVSTWEISPDELKKWGREILKPRGVMALMGSGQFKAGNWCRFCKARNQCRARSEEFLKLAQMEFRKPALLSDDEIAEVLKVADDLKKWTKDVYTHAMNEAITHDKHFDGFKLVAGRSNRKYTDTDEVIEAAKTAGYSDIYIKQLIGITEMQKLMGKKQFNNILGHLVYKPQGKITLVPESDKRQPIIKATAEADFKEEK